MGNLFNLERLNLADNDLGRDVDFNDMRNVPEEFGNLRSLTIFHILPQRFMRGLCLPAKLEGQLMTDFPPGVRVAPFCEE